MDNIIVDGATVEEQDKGKNLAAFFEASVEENLTFSDKRQLKG